MKSRSWIKTMATSALLSPRTAFRKTNSSPAPLTTVASTSSSIPLSMLATLTRLVEFLDENHLEEEGLYSKSGVGLERKEILRFCKGPGNLPDLSLYSPHSIASAVKEILSEMYAPLVPADISRQLLEAASSGRIDEEAENAVIEVFKQIRATTREFLHVLLNHLSNLAASRPSRISMTNLALHIGIALIRPTEDKSTLSSKNMMRRRKCVAEFLIRKASALPYDCVTEMNIPAIPELLSPPSIDVPPKQLHFIQATWDAGESSLTFEQLEEMFNKFGEIENLGINDQGNRAIIAYVTAESAEKAEHAAIPNVRIRRRKPRQGEKRREHSPKHSKLNNDPSLQNDGTGLLAGTSMIPTSKDGVAASRTSSLSESVLMQPIPSLNQRFSEQPQDDNIVVEDIDDEELSEQLRPVDLLQVDTAQPDSSECQTKVDEGIVDSAAARLNEHLSPKTTAEDLAPNKLTEQTPSHVLVESSHPAIASILHKDSAVETQQAEEIMLTSDQKHASIEIGSAPSVQVKSEMDESVGKSLPFPTQPSGNLRTINDTKPSTPAHRDGNDQVNQEPTEAITTPTTVASLRLPLSFPATEKHHEPTNDNTDSTVLYAKPTAAADSTTELTEPTSQMISQLAENELPNSDQPIATKSSSHTSSSHASTGALQSKLLDMEKILSTSTAALSATKLSNEFERAVFQLHRQILDMVEECLVLAGARCGENVTTKTSANAEFLDFLEAQSKTQVTILEVEVRAGQELLRLHKTQYEKERVELEEEITALRVGRTETERLCAELRADLRKCRSELACHVANATDIQRQKSALEEKLATSDNQLHSKDVALAKLQAEYDKMYRIAAEAQMRTEKYKRSGFDESLSYQIEHNSQLPTIPNYEKRARTRVGEDLPQTSKLFSKLSTSKIKLEDSEQPTELLRVLNTTKTSSRPSNVAALEAMKQQIARNIQDQIASTKAALREMEVCSTSGKTLEEEEEELRQLQQQLATRSSEMAAAMSESRSKLQELLDPTTASPTNDKHTGNDDIASNQEPTIFDSTALVNELIARAGKASVYNSNQPFQHGDASIDEPSQHPFFGIECGQQLIEYHRPTRDAQSLLYKKWTSDRSRKIAQLATYRDQQAVVQAQQSMHTFQQTLAEFRNQR
ncbi:hypothetical protein PF008_g13387 [Phytophthora fragariae]|uniref:Rho-GAP domain-containing protein n=1 Tax=Phytophthora fragariae TaxID=53985 RepID=A0A6G0RKX1_9STRA|nr:hypothetical protein PF008_g13387 [Phytophthora fragariae]